MNEDKIIHFRDRLQVLAFWLTTISLLASAFHFWPFDHNRLWEILCPSNSAILLGSIIPFTLLLIIKDRNSLKSHLPHISVFALIIISILSISFSPNLARSFGFTFKLKLTLIFGFILFSIALSDMKNVPRLIGVGTIALIVSLCACLTDRFVLHQSTFGFFTNGYKYGTYIAILTALCCTFLFLSDRILWKILALILTLGALLSGGTLGTIMGILSGFIMTILLTSKWSERYWIIASIVLAGVILRLLWAAGPLEILKQDLRLTEKNRQDVKQRYIEWQAEINLLESRTIMGTGAGCINENRSEFYYRLPKLNTLKSFDQNSWISTAAETGILGLVCFCWIIIHHFKLCYRDIRHSQMLKSKNQERILIASIAGLMGACVANLFSSVSYNGVLIVFVFILALITQCSNHFTGEAKKWIKKHSA